MFSWCETQNKANFSAWDESARAAAALTWAEPPEGPRSRATWRCGGSAHAESPRRPWARPSGRWAGHGVAEQPAQLGPREPPPEPRGPRVRARREPTSPAAAACPTLSARAPLAHPGRPLRRRCTHTTHVRSAQARRGGATRVGPKATGAGAPRTHCLHATRGEACSGDKTPPQQTTDEAPQQAAERRGSASCLTWSSRFTCSTLLPVNTEWRPSRIKDPTCPTAALTPSLASPGCGALRVTGDSRHTGSCSETKRTQTHVVGKRSWASQRLGKGLKLLHSPADLERRGDGTLHALTGRNSHKGFRLSTRTSDSQSFCATPGSPGSHTNLKYF